MSHFMDNQASYTLRRDVSSVLLRVLCLASAAGIAGCGADAGTSDPNKDVPEEDVLRAYLSYSGLDASKFSINHEFGFVRIEGDSALNLDDVRAQLYMQKGYDLFGFEGNADTPSGPLTPYTIKKIHPTVVGDIKLIFETPETHWWATEPANEFWKASFRNAAQQWSNAGSKIRISESNGGGGVGAWISVFITTRTFCDDDGDGTNDCPALAFFPGFGHPGGGILVDPTVSPGCIGGYLPPGCSGGGCFARLVHLALHELGHTLGFAHPGCGNHISGTSIDSVCANGPSYSTEMRTPFNCGDNGALKTDDINSIRKTYP